MAAVGTLARDVGVAPACEALRLPRATWYRRQKPKPTSERAFPSLPRC